MKKALRIRAAKQKSTRLMAAIALAAGLLVAPPQYGPAKAGVFGGAVAGGFIGGLVGGRGGMIGGAILGGIVGGISKSAKRHRKYRRNMKHRYNYYRRR